MITGPTAISEQLATKSELDFMLEFISCKKDIN